MPVRRTLLPPLLLLLVVPLASSWLLDGLVASWPAPEVQAPGQKRAEPERTQPLQLSEQQDESLDFVAVKSHPATSPASRRPRRTWTEGEETPTPTVRDIETTAPLYRVLKQRRRGDVFSPPTSSWKQSRPACIQRFICEVHMQEDHELTQAGDVEKSIANFLKRFHLEPPASAAYQYTYAAHMGRLMRGSPPSRCHELFSTCPLSKDEMLLLMQSQALLKATLV